MIWSDSFTSVSRFSEVYTPDAVIRVFKLLLVDYTITIVFLVVISRCLAIKNTKDDSASSVTLKMPLRPKNCQKIDQHNDRLLP